MKTLLSVICASVLWGAGNPFQAPLGPPPTGKNKTKATKREVTSLPKVKMLPGGRDLSSDLEQDSIAGAIVRPHHRLKQIVTDEPERLAELTGSFADRRQFYLGDTVYLQPREGKTLEEGRKYALIFEEKNLQVFKQQGYQLPGSLFNIVGEVKVIGTGPGFYRGEITSLQSEALRGAWVTTLPTLIEEPAPVNPPSEMTAKIAMGEDKETRAFSQGSLVIINRGTEEGMKPGYLFRVYRDTDPVLKARDIVDPDAKGEILILQSTPIASVGFIRKSHDSLRIGDTLIPAQSFDSAPPVPRREASEILVE